MKLPNKIIVNSNEFKKEYKDKFNINTLCIYNPLNKNNIVNYSKEKIKYNFFEKFKHLKIVFIGRLVDQKDPITFIKALKIIKQHGNASFSELKDFIKELGNRHEYEAIKIYYWFNGIFICWALFLF